MRRSCHLRLRLHAWYPWPLMDVIRGRVVDKCMRCGKERVLADYRVRI